MGEGWCSLSFRGTAAAIATWAWQAVREQAARQIV